MCMMELDLFYLNNKVIPARKATIEYYNIWVNDFNLYKKLLWRDGERDLDDNYYWFDYLLSFFLLLW